jgi:hypothetical protein
MIVLLHNKEAYLSKEPILYLSTVKPKYQECEMRKINLFLAFLNIMNKFQMYHHKKMASNKYKEAMKRKYEK